MTTGTGEYEVERAAVINAPRAVVYELVADFHRWSEWSPWEDLDPAMSRSYSGSPSGRGAIYEWSGNRKAGEGRMEITSAEAPSQVEIALQFIKPFKSSSVTTFVLEEHDGGTRVTWRLVGPKTFATRLMGIVKSMDKMIGPDFAKGLERLAQVSEAS